MQGLISLNWCAERTGFKGPPTNPPNSLITGLLSITVVFQTFKENKWHRSQPRTTANVHGLILEDEMIFFLLRLISVRCGTNFDKTIRTKKKEANI